MDVKHVIVVLSGKGGVGKSTVATQLALDIKSRGHKVGILDIDICGPSVPYLLNLEGKEIHSSSSGAWVPVYADNDEQLAVMSIGFLTPNRDSAVVWRGPKKTGMIRQFLKDVAWQGIEYLIIDTPPGTSDEHITLVEELRSHPSYGAVVVTTPQHVAVEDARRQVTFCIKTNLPIIGVVENLSGYVCPSCEDCSYIFSSGGGQELANLAKVPFLGRLPIDPKLNEISNGRVSLIECAPTSSTAKALASVVDNVIAAIPKLSELKSPA